MVNSSDPYQKLRGLAWYRARRLTIGAVAKEMQVSSKALSAFIKGGVPGPRTLRQMQTWYEGKRALPELPYRLTRGTLDEDLTIRIIALDVLLEDFTDDVRGKARGVFLLRLLRLYEEHGMPRPKSLLILLAANKEQFGEAFFGDHHPTKGAAQEERMMAERMRVSRHLIDGLPLGEENALAAVREIFNKVRHDEGTDRERQDPIDHLQEWIKGEICDEYLLANLEISDFPELN